jgi:hypothetical protein
VCVWALAFSVGALCTETVTDIVLKSINGD